MLNNLYHEDFKIQYAKIFDMEVKSVKICGVEMKFVIDKTVPKDEIHFVTKSGTYIQKINVKHTRNNQENAGSEKP